MNKLNRFFLLIAVSAISYAASAQKTGSTKYKCMIQMTNYEGYEAYVVVSLINPKGEYEKTLYMMGPDKEWYPHFKEWNKFAKKKPTNISAITGASIGGGARNVLNLEIENAKVDAGYKLRFESAVENQKYYPKDIEVPLTAQSLSTKTEGPNYIRYVRFSAGK